MPTIHGQSADIYHNFGFTGIVVIDVPGEVLVNTKPGRISIIVDFEDLRVLVLDYLRHQMIDNINSMNANEFENFLAFGDSESESEYPLLSVQVDSDDYHTRSLVYDKDAPPSK